MSEENSKYYGNHSKQRPKGIKKCLLEGQILELILHHWESGCLMEEGEMSCGDIPGRSSNICIEVEGKETKTVPGIVNRSCVVESVR